jgi:CelD/BcsL family acetyltransferase involved in cellulose biosynthesis
MDPAIDEAQTDTTGAPIQVDVLPAAELTGSLIEAWAARQSQSPTFRSPFFCPEYTLAVARFHSDCEVAVVRRGEEPVAFFPYHRLRDQTAVPISKGLADFQGIVAAEGISLSMPDLLRACGLVAWRYDHWISGQAQLIGGCAPWARTGSPRIDLADGYEAYAAERRAAGCQTLRQTQRKARKMEREVGPLRLVARTTQEDVFDTLIEWKLQQFRRIRCVNHLAETWKRPFLRELSQLQTPRLSGMMSALYAGDRLVAAHLGLLSDGVLHYWFPTYCPSHDRYSPGMVMLVELLSGCRELNIERIELGKGPERFKWSLQNGVADVCEGTVDLRPTRAHLQRAWYVFRERIRESAFRAPAQQLVRSLRAWREYR